MSFDPPAWVSAILRRLAGRLAASELGELDDPGSRAWLAILSGARALAPVLASSGCRSRRLRTVAGATSGCSRSRPTSSI
jgi:hypothetical protein